MMFYNDIEISIIINSGQQKLNVCLLQHIAMFIAESCNISLYI